MEFKSYINKYCDRINMINSLFGVKKLSLSYDRLVGNVESVDFDLLYFKLDDLEFSGMFVFGYEFFLSDLSEQEFKRTLGHNTLNFKIFNAYHKLKKKFRKVKISDILNKIQDEKKDSGKINIILRRILILAYYLNWEIVKDKKDIEGDSFIKISEKYLSKLKQRFDFTVVTSIYEDEKLFVFLNTRGKLNMVLKDYDSFSRVEIEKLVPKVLKKVFKIKKISFE